jgi:hypothetical protein
MNENEKLVNEILWKSFEQEFNNGNKDRARTLLRGCIETKRNQIYWEILNENNYSTTG